VRLSSYDCSRILSTHSFAYSVFTAVVRPVLQSQQAVGACFAVQLLHPDMPLPGCHQATHVCCHIVTYLKHSVDLFPQVAWSSSGGNSFLGGSMAQPSDFSMKTADEVDAEVKDLVERAYRCVCFCSGAGGCPCVHVTLCMLRSATA
jgi:hypothetical protein